MSLKKSPKYIILVDYISNTKSIFNILHKLFEPDSIKDLHDITDYMVHNNKDEHYLYVEDGIDKLSQTHKSDFSEICKYLANQHFTLENNHTICIKKNYVEDLKQIENSLDNFLIEGFYIYQASTKYSTLNKHRFLQKNVYDIKFIQDSIVYQLETLTDLHMHLGASMRIEYRIHNMLLNPKKVDTSVKPKNVTFVLNEHDIDTQNLLYSISLLEQLLISISILEPRCNDMNDSLQVEYLDMLKEVLKHIKDKNYFQISEKYDSLLQIRTDKYLDISYENNFLLYMSYQQFKDESIIYADKFLILYFIDLLQTTTNKYIRSATEIYLIMRNILKTSLVQQYGQIGFGYFSTYSRSTLRRAKIKSEKKDIIHSLYNLSVQLNKPLFIEARITPSNSAQNMYNDLKEYVDFYEKLDTKKFKLKFIYHFIKTKNNLSEIRFASLKHRLKKQSYDLLELLSSTHYNKDLRPYIAGIDAASKEYYTPPYVFAPIYRYFKSSKKLSSFYTKYDMPFFQNKEQSKNDSYDECNIDSVINYFDKDICTVDNKVSLKYTYHVGEDFRDITTGLRSIFEAVLFLDLRENDRIGHALALGLDANIFYSRIGTIQLNYEELFNNMIFIYYMLEKHTSVDIQINTYKTYAYEMILETGRYIYEDFDKTFSIDDFIDAWFLRRNCYIEYKMMKSKFEIKSLEEFLDYKDCMIVPDNDYTVSALPDLFALDIDETDIYERRYLTARYNKNAFKIFELYMSDYENSNENISSISYVINRGQKMYEHKILHSVETISFLQEVIMENMIKKRGINIEVMPTSNLLISHINTHEEHPMYKFNNINTEYIDKTSIFISSDNPMIQNTNIAKEYDYVYSYLKNKYGPKKALKYLNKISENSRNEFLR